MPHSAALPATRRAVVAGALGLAASAGPVAAWTQQPSPPLLMRALPRTGERIPALGLGTFMTFDLLPGAPRGHLQQVFRRYWDAGVRVLDTSPLYGTGEITLGDFISAAGVADQAFVSNKVWATGDYLADAGEAERRLAHSRMRLWRNRLDAVQVHNLVNVEQNLPLLQAWRREERVRMIGVTHHDTAYFERIAHWMTQGDLDMVQVRYSILTRQAEERILPLARDLGVAVMTHMPFEKGRLHALVGQRPVPDFAREIGVTTWAAYFLKWVLGNPGVACVLAATADPAHAAENVAALTGDLPDQALRLRMLRHLEAMPGFADLERTPWYPGKAYPGVIARAQARRAARLAP